MGKAPIAIAIIVVMLILLVLVIVAMTPASAQPAPYVPLDTTPVEVAPLETSTAATLPAPKSAAPEPIPGASAGAVVAGCTLCDAKGVYWCPKDTIKSSEWYNNQAALVSSYRVPEYDPATAPVTLGNDKYFWRELGDKCKV